MKLSSPRIASHSAALLADCFNDTFGKRYNVRCTGGGAEPRYLPATHSTPAVLTYREDFAASALHEIAHWCIAGTRRRAQDDFGYQYLPPPREAAQQQDFFDLEVRAQALEKLFAMSTGVEFVVSADNLDISPQLVAQFALAVDERFVELTNQANTRPPRAQQYLEALLALNHPLQELG